MSRTAQQPMGDGYWIRIQHCEGCDVFLGVNYPLEYCDDCRPKPNKPNSKAIAAIHKMFKPRDERGEGTSMVGRCLFAYLTAFGLLIGKWQSMQQQPYIVFIIEDEDPNNQPTDNN